MNGVELIVNKEQKAPTLFKNTLTKSKHTLASG